MNINMQSLNLFNNNYGLKSVQDRMERQQKRDDQIAFYEQQKENLKNVKANTLDEISRKLEMLQGYNDAIDAAKEEYNNSQIWHVLDEAQERGEKIAEAAEKMEPKTPEERREDMIEEATGVEREVDSPVGESLKSLKAATGSPDEIVGGRDEGMLSEAMDELSDMTEDMTEEEMEAIEEMTEELPDEGELLDETQLFADELQVLSTESTLPEKYRRIDLLA